MLFVCISLLLSFALCNAAPTSADMILHESRVQAPEGFVQKGPASSGQLISLNIGLAQGNITDLEKSLYEVSDPSSALYGRHLSKEVVETFVTPYPETVEAVTNWLSSYNIHAVAISPPGDWMSITLPVNEANKLLGTTFITFVHQSTGSQTIRTLSYSLPSGVRGFVDLVHPTINFPDFDFTGPLVSAPVAGAPNRENITNGAVNATCYNYMQPSCLQELYNIPTSKASQATNQLAVTGLIGQYANDADLKTFLSTYRPDISQTTNFELQTIDGGQNPQNSTRAGSEADLDVQYTIGLATGVPVTFTSVGPNNTDSLSGFLDVINFYLNQTHPPQVITTSYNAGEAYYSAALSQRLCNAYMQLGARGTSIIFSSGDGGVAGPRVNDGCTTFVPTFPSGCPYITVVGSTGNIPETASEFSSGGFSNYFPVPVYQQNDVQSYISNVGAAFNGLFNASGRGYPDVAAQGERVFIVTEGTEALVEGTSVSAPVIASIVSLLNDRLIAAGKPVLGFLNPFLYSATGRAAFNDITAGQQAGCRTGGFPVKSGWDPVSGLGTPDFNKLLTAVGL